MDTENKSIVGEIYKKLPLIAQDIGAIGKNRKNTQQNYTFRGIDDVYNALHDIMSNHGVFCVPEILDMKREERPTKSGGLLIWTVLKVKYTVYANDASNVCAVVVGEAMDTGDKGCNKAMAAAHKYLLLQILTIPTEEPNDSENETHEIGNPKSQVIPKKDNPGVDTKFEGKPVVSIADVTMTTGINKKTNKPWTKYHLKTSDGQDYSTFDKKIAESAKEAKQGAYGVILTLETEGKYTNVVNIEKMPEEYQSESNVEMDKELGRIAGEL